MFLLGVIGARLCHATLRFHCKLQCLFMIFNCTKRRFATVVASLFNSQMTKTKTKKSSKVDAESKQKPVLKTASIF